MITISPGHFGQGTGAVGLVDEVVEARKVAVEVTRVLRAFGVQVHFVEDRVSKNRQQNIRYLVSAHNNTTRDLDVSIHFNAVAGVKQAGIGTEVLYVNPAVEGLAKRLSAAIASAGKLKDRGAKRRTDLGFLNGTTKRAVLIEVCFINSKHDIANYTQHFHAICAAIARVFMQEVVPLPFSSEALTNRVLEVWADKQQVIKQLERGVQDGVFQEVWVQRAKAGTLTVVDYVALSALQFNSTLA